MNTHLNGKVIASAAIATAAIATATLSAVVLVRKKRADAQRRSKDATDTDLKNNIGPGEINPYADTPTDAANQN